MKKLISKEELGRIKRRDKGYCEDELTAGSTLHDRRALLAHIGAMEEKLSVKNKALNRVLKYLRSPEAEEAEYIERLLVEALL